MYPFSTRSALLLGAGLTALCSAPLAAQDEAASPTPDTAEEPQGNDIMVTARRRSESAQDIPLAVSVLDAKQLDETGAFNVNRLQQLAPTLQFLLGLFIFNEPLKPAQLFCFLLIWISILAHDATRPFVIHAGKQKVTVAGKDYLVEPALRADFALVNAFMADYLGNLAYVLTARNFNPVIAMAADTVIVEADNIVPVGLIAPDHVVTPAPLVDYVIAQG